MLSPKVSYGMANAFVATRELEGFPLSFGVA